MRVEARKENGIKARERKIGENSLSIHVVYTRRTLELKIELWRRERRILTRRENEDS